MLRALSKDTIIYGGGDLVGKLIAFVTFPLIAAALSPRLFGELELLNTFISLVGLIINCGLNNSLQRFYWDAGVDKHRQKLMVSSAIVLLLAFSAVCSLVVVLLSDYVITYTASLDLGISKTSLLLALAIVCFTQLLTFIQDLTRLQFAPLKFLALSFTTKGLTAIFSMVFVVWLNKGVEGYLFSSALVLFITLFVGFFLVKDVWAFTFDSQWAKTLLSFGYPFIYAGLGSILLSAADRWMLARMSSVSEVGLYSIAFRYASLVALFSFAFGQAWSPYAIKVKTEQPERYREIYSQIALALFTSMTVIAITCSLFAGEIVSLTLTKDYLGAATIFIVLCFTIVFNASTQVTAIGISIEKKVFLFAKITWISVVLNVGLNYLLIPVSGALGAAVATLVSSFFVTASYLFFSQRLHPIPIPWPGVVSVILMGTIMSISAVKLMSYELNPQLILLKAGIILLILIIGLWIVFGSKKSLWREGK